MRRRQRFAEQSNIIEIFEKEVKFEGEPIYPPKGSCKKCGKIIGQGIFMHTKHCRGQNG